MAFGSANHTSSIPPGFVDALVLYADTLGSDADLKAEFTALFAKMQENGGTDIIASTINGKYFGFQVSMTLADKFSALAEAIKRYNGTAIPQTYADFSCLSR